MSLRRLKVTITGDTSDQKVGPLEGLLHAIYADKGTLAATTDITITEAETAAPILTITNLAANLRYMPRDDVHTLAGAVQTQADERIPVSGDVRIVVAQGGAGTAGTLYFYVEEPC